MHLSCITNNETNTDYESDPTNPHLLDMRHRLKNDNNLIMKEHIKAAKSTNLPAPQQTPIHILAFGLKFWLISRHM